MANANRRNAGSSPGIRGNNSTSGNHLVDPTENVKALVAAEGVWRDRMFALESKWRDKLDAVRGEHVRELAKEHADCDHVLHQSEANQLDKAEKLLQERMHESEQNRNEALEKAAQTIQSGLDKAERQLQIALQDAEKRVNDKFNPLLDRLAALEKLSAMGEGRQRVEDPHMAAFVTRMEAVADAIKNNVGVNKGIGISWGAIVGAGGLVVALIMGMTFLTTFIRGPVQSTAAPVAQMQIPQGYMLVPAAPQQPTR